MIVALAGRRIDAPDAETARFPATEIARVETEIREIFADDRATVLVCAAASGADLLALDAATAVGMRKRIVLPFSVERFREGSVVDRPGSYPWGEQFDRFIREARSTSDLVLLELDPDDEDAYLKANVAILEQALEVARESSDVVEALVVWDERSRGPDDVTEQFLREAQTRMPVKSIRTSST